MGKTLEIEWLRLEDGAPVGKYPTEITYTGDYVCPMCGRRAEYEEGQIGQEANGNDIYGWWFNCFHCQIGTDETEGSLSDC